MSQLDLHQVEEWGSRIQTLVIGSSLFQSAETLALYHPFHNEVPTQQIFERAKKEGKNVVYPHAPMEGHPLDFYQINSLIELSPTPWGPLGPNLKVGQSPVSYDTVDLMVIPGLAFDRKGRRLGRGKGFYDRSLKQFPGVKLGVAYAFQVIESVPCSPEDEPVQYLATELELFQVS